MDKLLQSLIQIPSVNPHLTDEPSNEMALANFVRDWLVQQGLKARIEEVQNNRPNVYAEVGEGSPTLCLCAHLDTVGVKEMTIPPFTPTIEGGKVYGRGSADMKGGLAAVMIAASWLAKHPIKGKLILALVCDEEYGSIGAADFVKKYKADACILTEPSDLKMVIAHKGFMLGKITTTGKSAHGSRWDLGESAITKMGPILTQLEALDRTVLRKRIDPLVGPASMHVSLIQGGSGVSTYASECTLHLERRTLPSEKLLTIQKELEEIAPIEWYMCRPPFACDPQEKIAECVKTAFREVMKQEVKTTGWGVWTDAAFFQQAGIPTVNIGPIGFGLHEPVEWVDLDSVMQTAEILFKTTNYFY